MYVGKKLVNIGWIGGRGRPYYFVCFFIFETCRIFQVKKIPCIFTAESA